jgi:hypothetical protein
MSQTPKEWDMGLGFHDTSLTGLVPGQPAQVPPPPPIPLQQRFPCCWAGARPR